MSGKRKLQSGSARNDALQALLAAKEKGVKNQFEDAPSDEDRVFDEVDEETYNSIQTKRLRDDFIVDDDGLGYADHGHEEDWGEGDDVSSDADEGGRKVLKNRKKIRKAGAKEAPAAKKQAGDMEKYMRMNPSSKIGRNLTRSVDSLGSMAAAAIGGLAPHSRAGQAISQNADDILASFEQTVSQPVKPASAGSRQQAVKAANRHMALINNAGGAVYRPSFETNSAVTPTDLDDLDDVLNAPVMGLSALKKVKSQPLHLVDDDLPQDVDAPMLPETEMLDEASQAQLALDQQSREEKEAREKQLAYEAEAFGIKAEGEVTQAKKVKRIVTAVPKKKAEPAELQTSPTVQDESWFEVQDGPAAAPSSQAEGLAAQVQNLTHYAENEKLVFFWLDAIEEKGIVYLFGKIKNQASGAFESCCVQLNNIDRNLFVLPRQPEGESKAPAEMMAAVREEMSDLMQRHKVTSWRSKTVTKKYAFELADIPSESEYLQILMPFKQPSLPADLEGKTFSKVFGTGTNALETVILKYNLMGPCWLEMDGAQLMASPISWCHLDLTLDVKAFPKGIQQLTENRPAPPLTMMSLSIKTMQGANKLNEIVACSMLVYQNVQMDGPTAREDQKPAQRFTAARQVIGMPWPTGFQETIKQHQLPIQLFNAEMGMLNWLTAIMKKVDADVILGHNILGFELEVLLQRMKALKVKTWSRLGRLKRDNFPPLKAQRGFGESTYASRLAASGRLVCDTYLAAKEHVRSKSYSLSTLVETLLKIKRTDVDYDKTDLYYAQARDLLFFVQHTEKDAYLATSLAFNLMILPLSKQITNLAGNLWARTLTGGRAERNEWLLLHEFHRSGFIVPDKEFGAKSKFAKGKGKGNARGGGDEDEANENDNEAAEQELEAQTAIKTNGRRKPAYAGGLVLEPKKGLYDKYVLLLDFNSLYPSIIQEYNICFTTVDRHYGETDENGEEVLPSVPDANLEYGILPRLLGTLVERRRAVKALLKKASGNEYAQLDLRQKALKLTANSMYGCLGFTYSRFYAKPLAVLITMKGREILQNTVDLAEKSLNLNVIYGDTDSIMINTATEELSKVKEIGRALKQEVNKKYKKLEIEMDGFFKRMLLLKKKKYAALLVTEQADGTIVTTPEYKGLDLVRRDWCALSHDVSNYVLDQILSGLPKDEVVTNLQTFLRQVGQETREGKIPLEKFIINKGLTKQPEEYPDAKNQPHVQVALRLRSKGRGLQAGDTIQYIICLTKEESEGAPKSKDGGGIASRAYHPDEIKRVDSGLTVDYEYYLQNQIHPPVDRLCQPIDGMDSVLLAEFLGLDAAKFKHAISNVPDEEEVLTSFATILTDEERYKDAERWQITCHACAKEQVFQGVLRANEKGHESGMTCEACKTPFHVNVLERQLQKAVHRQLRRFHEFWLVCEECHTKSRDSSVHGDHCLTSGCSGRYRMAFSNTQLFNQLSYLKWIVDASAWLQRYDGASATETSGPAEPKYSAETVLLVREEQHRMQPLVACVDQFMNQMARSWVNLGPLFTYGRQALLVSR